MTKEEKSREKELKNLIYLRSKLIKEFKKELKQYKQELNSLGTKHYTQRRK